MAYNKAKEEWKWKKWKETEEEQLRLSGMNEASIQELRCRDWEEFKAERRYLEHRVSYPEYLDLRCLEMKEPEINRIQTLIDSIDDERLLHILMVSDRKTLQILLLKIMGFSVGEIAVRLRLSERAVYCRIDRLKKKIKKIL